ncbi:MAG TPA: DNA/RNA helicase domain-containing protein [Edaphobacter sp.]|nr:DNA/RNA helicase domain-containing protein [Edaphobacter sp.]
MKSAEKRIYRKNAYRVLLTRARQGMVIYVPEGSSDDATNLPGDFDRTARFLMECGVLPLEEVAPVEKEGVVELTSLFD